MVKETKTLIERGIPEDSFFTVTLQDGSVHTEIDTSWHENSEELRCEYFGGTKLVRVSTVPIKHIRIQHGTLEKELDVPEGHQVYQAIRSEAIFVPGLPTRNRILGRVVGLVQDGVVIEEHFLNALMGEVMGYKR